MYSCRILFVVQKHLRNLFVFLAVISTASGSCITDFYGTSGEPCVACPRNSFSNNGSMYVTDCSCSLGFYKETHMLNPAHASRRYSSVFQNKFYMSLLGDSLGARAWRPTQNKIGEWMEVDLDESMQLQGIVVEGIPQSNEWVTNFNLECRETIDATLNTTLVNFSQVSPSRQIIFFWLLVLVHDMCELLC